MVKAGVNVRAAVLDVAKTERLVDLSLKLEFLDKSRDKSSNSLTHKKVESCFKCLSGSVSLHTQICTKEV
jgi:translation initiation factor 2 alpha subunit (eIF-2alpha)